MFQMNRDGSRKVGILLGVVGVTSLVVAGVIAIPMTGAAVWGDPFLVIPWLAGTVGGVCFLVLGVILVKVK
jgi:hypothetical protein